jgi:hypothetical protein
VTKPKQPTKTAQLDIIAHRRAHVAQLRLRGASEREIAQALAQSTVRNHETGEPWSLATISRDVQALDAEWREAAALAIEVHRARLLAELRELRRVAWSKGDLDLALRGIKHEIELLGAAVPPTIHLHHTTPPPPPPRWRIVDVYAGDPPPAKLPGERLVQVMRPYPRGEEEPVG